MVWNYNHNRTWDYEAHEEGSKLTMHSSKPLEVEPLLTCWFCWSEIVYPAGEEEASEIKVNENLKCADWVHQRTMLKQRQYES